MKIALVALSILALTACQMQLPTKTTATAEQSSHTMSDHTLIVFYQNGKKSEVLALFKRLNTQVVYDYKTMNSFAIAVNASESEKIKKQLENDPNVLAVNDNEMQQLH